MKEATRKLLEKAGHSIKTAEKLSEPDEVEFVATRAYYAMFYIAEAVLFEKGLAFKKHSAVHAAFGEHIAKKGLLDSKFHRWLIEAFSARISSDYETNTAIPLATATKMIEQAKEFLEAAQQYLSGRDTT
ncbi:MAG: hypothetical protein A3G87_06245 [Omnitrophica bacterium RIFCSPLOWO2_12_FULL_50_11]|nr:MAG: hypothetical protein A3G87_06245 [Omnitrophica bacterium RIFCSPLOWO2_12_FULL_50_11]